MNCTDVAELLSPHVDGALDPRAGVDVDTHLAACPSCRDRRIQIENLRSLLRSFEDDGAVAPDPADLAGRVRSEAAQPASSRRTPLLALIGLGVLAAVVLLVAVNFLSGFHYSPAPLPPPSSDPPIHRPADSPIHVQNCRFRLSLGSPDPALFDRLSTFFRSAPGGVRETRAEDGLSIEFVVAVLPDADVAGFRRRLSGFVDGLDIRNGRWEWSTSQR